MPRSREGWAAVLLSAALILLVTAAEIKLWRVAPVQREESIVLEQSFYLSDLPWDDATTGWMAIAHGGLPARDKSFSGQPMRLRGDAYAKGLGTHPVSEIVYAIDPDYERFESTIGVDDEVAEGSGGVEFFVFLDEVLVFRSGVMRAGDPPKRVSQILSGAQRLRLAVSDESVGAIANSADWAEARFVRRIAGEQSTLGAGVGPGSGLERGRAREKAQREAGDLFSTAGDEIDSRGLESIGEAGRITAAYDAPSGELLLSNGRIAVALGYGGPNHGTLTVYDLASRRYVAYRVSPTLKLADGRELQLAGDTSRGEDGYAFSSVRDEALGEGQQLAAQFRGGNEVVTQTISVFAGQPYLVLQLSVGEAQDSRTQHGEGQARFRLFDLGTGGFLLGDEVEYLADYSRPRHGLAVDDGITRREAVGPGNPVFLRSDSLPRALILATLDGTDAPAELWLAKETGSALTKLRFESPEALRGVRGSSSSRVYLEVADSDDPRFAFDRFKSAMARIAPPPPLPSWVKYQWLSWYVYYMNIGEDVIRRQIDYISENLSDLGTWSILVDAGWYVSEGREGADWRTVDAEKFPSGLRGLVDYAHSRGLKVVLYFSTPYLDGRRRWGDWLGLRTLIEQHPEWLILLGEDQERKSYVVDYSNPEARGYVGSILRDFFEVYDVDGIKVDGLGNADGAMVDERRIDRFGLVDKVAGQTLEIYRFIYDAASSIKKDVYVESGWMTPLLAGPYAHTFRFGDEYPSYTNNYPAPGLLEHVDYAVLQKMALGQRPNLGAVWGDPNSSVVNQWWLQAGLALGTQTVLSFDLPAMTLETLSQYRSILTQYNAFEGRTVYERSLRPSYFATTVGPMTYLGMVARGGESRPVRIALRDVGVDENKESVGYDASSHRFFRPRGRVWTELRPETFRLFVIRSAPGVVWTNSSLRGEKAGSSSYEVEVRGPRAIEGFAYIYAPDPRRVSVDGRRLARSLVPMADENHYTYDGRTGIVELRYGHDKPHIVRVEYR